MKAASATRRIALAGNPNTGKSTLFNRLTGGRARVANYPGLTVEKESGTFRLSKSGLVELVDVPGTYSLSARSAEERIAMLAIAGLDSEPRPDAVLLIVDATSLERNLYLALQIVELGVPTVIAVNMVDMLAERNLTIDAQELARRLGIPVVPISAKSTDSLAPLLEALDDVLETPGIGVSGAEWMPKAGPLSEDLEAVGQSLPATWCEGPAVRRSALAAWALASIDDQDEFTDIPLDLRRAVRDRRGLARAAGRDLDLDLTRMRYGWIDQNAAHFVRRRAGGAVTSTDRIDRVLLHPLVGFGVFLLVMGIVFQSLFSWSNPAIGWIESVFASVRDYLAGVLPPSLVTEFLLDGVIEGVGSVLVFLPQILLLFFFLALMEDSGYLARVAVLMDRVMRSIGLHGKAFVPMMSGFACAVPAILATRTMERRRDRLLTMLVIPLMTCSARLPVYTLIIAALFPPDRLFGLLPMQGLLMVCLYVFSTCMALVVAGVLGKTLVRGPRIPLLMELPPYRMPHWLSVARKMLTRSRMFVTEAGGIILVCTIVMWFGLTFPRAAQVETTADTGTSSAAALEGSYAGRLGRAIEPVLEPLGFDWKIGIGLVGAFAAREVFVSTMGVVYGLGEDQDEQSMGLQGHIRAEMRADGKPVYTPLVGISLMAFFALACQCMSTLAIVRRESNSWKWPAFLFAYTLVLAWGTSFFIYQGGRMLGLG